MVLDVLPAGGLRLEKLRPVQVGAGFAECAAGVLSVERGGPSPPEILLLDEQGRLFAHLSDSILVREGYEKQFETLKVLGRVPDARAATSHAKGSRPRLRDAGANSKRAPVRPTKPNARLGRLSRVVFVVWITTVEPETGAAAHRDEVTIDGGGGTVVAGLQDMHSHNSLWSGPFYLAAGVTTTREYG